VAYLETLLETLKRNSAAIYTLKIYKDVPGGELTDKTPYRSAFNFQLKRQGEEGTSHYSPGGQGELIGAVTELTEVVKGLRDSRLGLPAPGADEGEDDEPEDSGLGFIGKILDHPVMGPIAGDLIKKFTNGGGTGQLAGSPAGTMAGVPGSLLSTDQEAKITKAISVLRRVDQELGDHLLRLSAHAAANPPGYAQLLQVLNTM
jgi:hypothetical protein